jgi:hypothetical protein
MIRRTLVAPGTPEGAVLGFQQNRRLALSHTRAWSDVDAEAYARTTTGTGAPFEPFMLAAARRTQDVAREIFFANALRGHVDQRRIAHAPGHRQRRGRRLPQRRLYRHCALR